MPSWTIHCYVANKVALDLDIDKNTFLFGNILPDLDYANFDAHYYGTLMCENCKDEDLPDLNRFLKTYKNKLHDPLILGYYCHLLTDYYFNNYTYSNKWLIDPKTNKTIGFYTFDNQKTIANYTSRQNIKRKDFAKFNITLYDNFNVTLPKNSRNISSHFKLLEPVFIKKDDIEFMIEKMYYFLEKSKTSDHKYTIFSEEELYKLTNDTIEFIKQKFKESNLNNIKTKKV